ncbi:glycosyltransferase family 4 protein [Staphylococcus hyicus]|uniref:glycosyltransferase family 4 protein n=1 Tax=Staphylococcus hyicus TaxID=1284 RepID=UPI002A835B56|nr:glycosyltransferase family 4 protein [Staphylococcus hyicus]MDY3697224.1 glycosyltransferase family 4 protein [Staphylococcus hyicus]
MNILFLTMVKINSKSEEGIYQDFINEISRRGNNVFVVTPIESRENRETYLVDEDNVKILRVKTGNVTKTSKLKKGINQLKLQSQFNKAIKNFYKDISFDLIVYSTPPITFSKLITKLKKDFNAITYLMLKDIFPQNAVDIQMIKNNSILYKFFRKKELNTYKVSDLIGVMSKENKNYIIKHSNVKPEKIHIFRNSIYEMNLSSSNRSVLTKYGIDINKKILIYGGNIGEPQGYKNIIAFIKRFIEVKNANLIIIGSGTRFNDVKAAAKNIKDVFVLDQLPKREYDALLNHSDIGMIFLDERFTIPNYPSRLTSYLSLGKPVIASVDNCTDISSDIEKNNVGFSSNSKNTDLLIKNINKLTSDKELYKQLSENAISFFNREFKIEDNVDRMISEIRRYQNEKNL